MGEVLARMAYSNLPLQFEALSVDEQQKLIKILHTLALPGYQHQRLGFGAATIEQVQAIYHFYPSTVPWESPLALDSTDLRTLFDAFIPQLVGERVAETLTAIKDGSRWPDAQIAAKALQVTRTAFNTVRPEAVNPPTGAALLHCKLVSISCSCQTSNSRAGAAFLEIDGKRYLGSSATMDQVLELRREAGLKKHATGFCKLLGCQVAFDKLYNAVQQRGGWQEVRGMPNPAATLASAVHVCDHPMQS